MCDMTRDESVSRYFELNKLDGYGFLMIVMEIIAERMDYTGEECSVTYSQSEWARISRCSRNKVNKLMDKLDTIDWIHVSIEDDCTTVDIPKMAEWRDEYSRKKSGQGPDRGRTKSHRGDQEEKIRKKDYNSLDNIKDRVQIILESEVVDPRNVESVAKLTGSSPKRAAEAISQLGITRRAPQSH